MWKQVDRSEREQIENDEDYITASTISQSDKRKVSAGGDIPIAFYL
ncbi:hypothetical protein ACMA1I_20595 [Pontibacter sp. 13R65]